MKPFTTQELEACGFFSKIFGSKPTENGWKELNNLLAEATDMNGVAADAVKGALKKWGVKFTEENLNERSSIYRKLGVHSRHAAAQMVNRQEEQPRNSSDT